MVFVAKMGFFIAYNIIRRSKEDAPVQCARCNVVCEVCANTSRMLETLHISMDFSDFLESNGVCYKVVRTSARAEPYSAKRQM